MTTHAVPKGGGVPAGAQPLPADLVPMIVRDLQAVGEYRVVLDPREAQRLVDVRWAALGAGRALGRTVKVVTSRAIETRNAPITVLVTFVDGRRAAIPAQRQQADRR
jgi:hypothetical protein